MVSRFIVATSLFIAPASLHAGTAAICDDDAPLALPSELAGWTGGTALPVTTMTDYSPEHAPLEAVGTTLALHPAEAVSYTVAPERAVEKGRFGGLMRVHAAKAGRIRIALGLAAWIDVIGDGRRLASVGHGHGPQCSGIRKIVDFDVQTGDYVLQIVNAPEATIRVMAVGAASEPLDHTH